MPWPETDVQQPGGEPVDAVSLLKVDLAAVDGVVAEYWDVSHADDLEARRHKDEVAIEVCRRTREYLALEDAFVRAVEGAVADAGLLREMQAGQTKALELVEAIEQSDPRNNQRDSAVRVLGDFMLRHAQGELEGVFKHVAASRLNLFDLGEQLRRSRAEGTLSQGALPRRLPGAAAHDSALPQG
ncbi:MAG: hypothetical protein MUF07_09935 [Steroidobacteraceae bacterium]|jgi:hypothetical protein|nr:hypothetical protein [Steroidobacteraceae bacterium]